MIASSLYFRITASIPALRVSRRFFASASLYFFALSEPFSCAVINLVPVLDPGALLTAVATAPARQGDAALIVEDRGMIAALHVSQVHEVATCTVEGDHVLDGRGRTLALLDPRDLVRRALGRVQATRGAGEPELDTMLADDPAGIDSGVPALVLDGDTTFGP